MNSYDQLWQITKKLPQDFKPYGVAERLTKSCFDFCRHFQPLAEFGPDWGVCTNPVSHRAGLLTFERQGCPQFEGI